jgi:hypothetical protein
MAPARHWATTSRCRRPTLEFDVRGSAADFVALTQIGDQPLISPASAPTLQIGQHSVLPTGAYLGGPIGQAVVLLTATVMATISVAVVVAITAARVKVRQAKGRRRPRTPANMSAVPVLSSSRAVAVVRVRGARQCDNRSCDDKSCGSQCNPHGSRSLAYIFSIAEYRFCCPERTEARPSSLPKFVALLA